MHRDDRPGARRSRGPGLGEAELPARRQGQHGQARRGSREVSGRRHQDPALDERRHQEGRRRKAGHVPQQDRLSGEVARLFRRSRSSATISSATSQRNAVFQRNYMLEQAGQAGRREGVGHDAAHGQRLLQPIDERHQLPGRHSAAAVLRFQDRSRRSTSAASAW